jgi:hypothetical protein
VEDAARHAEERGHGQEPGAEEDEERRVVIAGRPPARAHDRQAPTEDRKRQEPAELTGELLVQQAQRARRTGLSATATDRDHVRRQRNSARTGRALRSWRE